MLSGLVLARHWGSPARGRRVRRIKGGQAIRGLEGVYSSSDVSVLPEGLCKPMSISSYSPMTFAARPMPLPMMPALPALLPRREGDRFIAGASEAMTASDAWTAKQPTNYQPPIPAWNLNAAAFASMAVPPYIATALNTPHPGPTAKTQPQPAQADAPVHPVPPQPPGTTALRIVYNNDEHEKPQIKPHLISGFRFFQPPGGSRRTARIAPERGG